MSPCGHALCALVDGECSLASGVSRGCQTGPRFALAFPPEVVEEVSRLLEALAPAPTDEAEARHRVAAARLAFLFRREARSNRNLLSLATEEELEPELGARLEALCRRRG